MGFVVWSRPPEFEIRPRTGLSRWRDRPEPAIWLLVAGPGSGKTCAALLLADSAERPALFLNAQVAPPARRNFPPGSADGAGQDLAAYLSASPTVAGAELAQRFKDHVARTHPEGLTIVLDSVDRILDDPVAREFLEAWLADAALPWGTIVTSRIPLPFAIARQVATGDIAILDRADLWLDDQEAQDWTEGLPVQAEVLCQVQGWPLGIKGIRTFFAASEANERSALGFLQDLADQELLTALPAEIRAKVARLGALPLVDPHALASWWPQGDLVAACERLAQWGLLIGAAGDHLCWNALARPGIEEAWQGLISQEQRPGFIATLAQALCTRDPEGALALCVEREAWDQGLKILESVKENLNRDGDFRGLLPWLARFPESYGQSDGTFNLIFGKILLKSGNYSESAGRLRRSSEIFRNSGDNAGEFEAINTIILILIDKYDRNCFLNYNTRLMQLENFANTEQKLKYRGHLACFYMNEGDFLEARRNFRIVLDHPHFGVEVVMVLQQLAALNLGCIEMDCGDFQAARRSLLRAQRLANDVPVRSVVVSEIALRLTLLGVYLGDQGGELSRFPSDTFPALGPGLEFLLVLEGEYCLLRDRDQEAAERFERALDGLSATGQDIPILAGSILGEIAIVERRRNNIDRALLLHERAFEATKAVSREVALVLTEWSITLLAAGEIGAAQTKLQEATECLHGLVAPHLATGIALAQAVAWFRLGSRDRADQALQDALDFLRQGPYEHALVRWIEIAPDLWELLAQSGEKEIVARAEELFPRRARAIRAIVAARSGMASRILPALIPERIVIRGFGSLEVRVGSALVASWPRKKAKAMLAHLLLAPAGLSGEDLCDRLFPGHDPAESITWLGNLSSTLRKTLEPQLTSRNKSRYLTLKNRHYAMERTTFWLDVAAFDRAAAEGRRHWIAGCAVAATEAFEQALSLYRGDLFADGDLLEWFEVERHHYRGSAIAMRHQLADHYLASGQYEEARAHWIAILGLDVTDERGHCGLMRLYAQFGERRRLREQFLLLQEALRQHLDCEPSDATIALYDRLAVLMPATDRSGTSVQSYGPS